MFADSIAEDFPATKIYLKDWHFQIDFPGHSPYKVPEIFQGKIKSILHVTLGLLWVAPLAFSGSLTSGRIKNIFFNSFQIP